jgi:replicative DNA helicase
LGACLRSKENISIVIDGLRAEDFSSPLRKVVFEGIKTLYEKKAPVDVLTLSNTLKSHGILASRLAELEDSYLDGFDLEYYISQVKINSRRKELQNFLSRSIEEIQSSSIEYPNWKRRSSMG